MLIRQQRLQNQKACLSARSFSWLAIASCLLLNGSDAAVAGGFELFDQSSRATGLGGAVVARVDHPAALFYNVGGLAFVEQDAPKTEIGVATSYLSQSSYQGGNPGVGDGTTGEQEEVLSHRPHLFWVKPISESVRIGVGHYQAFGFDTEWRDPAIFSGRFLSTSAELTALDVNAGAAIRLTRDLGLGIGIVYRSSELVVQRRFPGSAPDSLDVLDVASFKIDTATADGFGWHAGIQNRLGEAFAWGASYRSEIQVDHQGAGKLTQISTGNDSLDELFKLTVPFGMDLGFQTSIHYPAQAAAGLAFGSDKTFLIEADITWTAWSDFQINALTYPAHPAFDQAFSCTGLETADPAKCPWSDIQSLRLGVQFTTDHGTEFRFGAVVDEKSPQPPEDLGPFFPDGDRTTFSFGLGRDWLDVAISWTEVAEQTTTNNFETFNGTYVGDTLVASFTVKK